MERISARQKTLLITMMETHMTVTNGRFQSARGVQFTETIWNDIQRELNLIGPAKSITQWKKCWKDLRLGVKSKLTKLRQHRMATGGGDPSSLTVNENDERIIRLTGVEGFDGNADVPEGGLNMVTSPFTLTPNIEEEINNSEEEFNSTISFGPEDFQETEYSQTLPSTLRFMDIEQSSTPHTSNSNRNVLTTTPTITTIVTSPIISNPTTTTPSGITTRISSTSSNSTPQFGRGFTNESSNNSRRNPYIGSAVDKSIVNQETTNDLLGQLLLAVNKTSELLTKIYNQSCH